MSWTIEKIVATTFCLLTTIPLFAQDYLHQNKERLRKQAFKLSFLTPFQGYTEVGYERSFVPNGSLDCGVAMIGLGYHLMGRKAAGGAIRGGYKFQIFPNYYRKTSAIYHPLKGAYVKSELSLLYYYEKENNSPYYSVGRYIGYGQTEPHVTHVACNLIGGMQWVMTNHFLVDIYAGVGYALGKPFTGYDKGYFIHFELNDDLPIIYTCGLRIGWLL